MKKFKSIGFSVLFGLKVILSLAVFAAFAFTGNTEAGVVLGTTPSVSWPFGEADLQQPAYAATLAVTITNQLTILDPAILTGNMTINLTLEQTVRKGAMLLCELTTTATEVTTFGTGFTSPTLTGVAGKTKIMMFMYDGTTFKPWAAGYQID